MDNFYYVGFNANNAICNEKFFSGSITLFPTNEKGNIYFINRNDKINSDDILYLNYKNFIKNTLNRLIEKDLNIIIMCVKEKVRNDEYFALS